MHVRSAYYMQPQRLAVVGTNLDHRPDSGCRPGGPDTGERSRQTKPVLIRQDGRPTSGDCPLTCPTKTLSDLRLTSPELPGGRHTIL